MGSLVTYYEFSCSCTKQGTNEQKKTNLQGKSNKFSHFLKKEKKEKLFVCLFLTEKLQNVPRRKKRKKKARNSQGESHRLTRKEITGFFFCFKICEKEVTNFIRKKWQIQNEPFKANRVLAFLFPHWKTKINSTIYFVIINLQKMPAVANMIQMNTHICKLIFHLF